MEDEIKSRLLKSNKIGKIEALLRAEIFQLLGEDDITKRTETGENWLIDEVIREYLKFRGYENTQLVFEAG